MSGLLVSSDEILAAFNEAYVSVPAEEMALAEERWDEMAPLLMERIARMAPEDEALIWVAIYLMAQQRETRAFPVLCRVARESGAGLCELLGDGVFEDLGTILARVFDGDETSLCALIEDGAVEEALRAAAISAIQHLVREKHLTRAWAQGLLERLAPALSQKSEGFLALGWLSALVDMQFTDLMPLAEAAFAEDRIDPMLMSAREFGAEMRVVREDDHAYMADRYANFFAVDRLCAFATGDADEMEDDDGWKDEITQPITNPLRNVGRNDPCICGSGKKFKKCCLGK